MFCNIQEQDVKTVSLIWQVHQRQKTYCSTDDRCFEQSRKVTGCHGVQVKTAEKLVRSRSSFTGPKIRPSRSPPRILPRSASPSSTSQLPHGWWSPTTATFWTKRVHPNRRSLSEWSWYNTSYVSHVCRTTFNARSNARTRLQITYASNLSPPGSAHVYPWSSTCYDDAPTGAPTRSSSSPRSPGSSWTPRSTAYTFHTNIAHFNFVWKCVDNDTARHGHAFELRLIEKINKVYWFTPDLFCFALNVDSP